MIMSVNTTMKYAIKPQIASDKYLVAQVIASSRVCIGRLSRVMYISSIVVRITLEIRITIPPTLAPRKSGFLKFVSFPMGYTPPSLSGQIMPLHTSFLFSSRYCKLAPLAITEKIDTMVQQFVQLGFTQGEAEEMKEMKNYDYIVVNDTVEEAAEQIRGIIKAESVKTKRIINIVEKELKL